MLPRNSIARKFMLLAALVLVASLVVVLVAYHIAVPAQNTQASKNQLSATALTSSPTPTVPTHDAASPSPSPTPTTPPAINPATVLGIDSNPGRYFTGINWVRLGYPSCGFGDLTGEHLRTTIQNYHSMGLRVLLIVCQPASSGSRLLNPQLFADIAQGNADAVQCGNEEMKQNALTTYVTPVNFARYFDMCVRAVHAVQPTTPVILGALDPQVVGSDNSPLYYQVNYLNQMQTAMNTQVHPGGNWSWRAQIVGMIDSWHNGYPSQYINNLYALFAFWAQQFQVNLNNGDLGKHLWVVEGTGCFKGCGIDQYSSYQVAVSHILTLISDAQTTMRYKVPYFYFSDRDFVLSGVYWPIGILDTQGRAKPIRQDLSMGARVLNMRCASGQVNVVSQEQLLAKLYQGCSLPSNYLSILTN
ncbi:MAG TPA: hypothetical protein VNE38_20330 [Ktedonobacteraceae bacterium]|nr:hypothetical protein [Ktedonobacteraceae bacterium]HVB75905.1 hypothetical protein [Ktedonobacteraceae bacterium]